MRNTVQTAITVAMTMALAVPAAFAGHIAPAAGPTVTACFLDGPAEPNYAIVRVTTSAIFARIGVNLEWRDARHCPSEALRISFTNGAPRPSAPVRWLTRCPLKELTS